MRQFLVFVVTFLLGYVLLVFSHHAFFERAGLMVVGFSVFFLGYVFGAVAGWWPWVVSHQKAFFSASFAAGMMILLPFIANSLGGAIILLPLVLAWVGMNWVGLKLTQRIRTRLGKRN